MSDPDHDFDSLFVESLQSSIQSSMQSLTSVSSNNQYQSNSECFDSKNCEFCQTCQNQPPEQPKESIHLDNLFAQPPLPLSALFGAPPRYPVSLEESLILQEGYRLFLKRERIHHQQTIEKNYLTYLEFVHQAQLWFPFTFRCPYVYRKGQQGKTCYQVNPSLNQSKQWQAITAQNSSQSTPSYTCDKHPHTTLEMTSILPSAKYDSMKNRNDSQMNLDKLKLEDAANLQDLLKCLEAYRLFNQNPNLKYETFRNRVFDYAHFILHSNRFSMFVPANNQCYNQCGSCLFCESQGGTNCDTICDTNCDAMFNSTKLTV